MTRTSAKQQLESGPSATRLAISDEQLRQQRNADALRWLQRTGNDDLIPILGLDGAERAPGMCRNCGKRMSPLQMRVTDYRRLGFCSQECRADKASQTVDKRLNLPAHGSK